MYFNKILKSIINIIILINNINSYLIKKEGKYVRFYINEKINYRFKIEMPSEIYQIEKYNNQELINNKPQKEYINSDKTDIVSSTINKIKKELDKEICYNNKKTLIKLGTTEFTSTIKCDSDKAIISLDNNTIAIKNLFKFNGIYYMSSEYKIYKKDKLCISNTLTSTCYDPSYIKIDAEDLNIIFDNFDTRLEAHKIYLPNGKYNIEINTETKKICIMYNLLKENNYTTILNQEPIKCKNDICNERYDYNIKFSNADISIIKLN